MIILSLDGGASRTRGVLFTEKGEILYYQETQATSLSRPDVDAPCLIGTFIQELAARAGLELGGIALVNVGVAGVTNQEARDRLFKELDRLGVTDRAIVTSDVEAAYETVWGDSPGVLVCVGTGAIAWAQDEQGNRYRASGKGPLLGGDPGSAFWMGKTAMVHLIMSEGTSIEVDDESDKDFEVFRNQVLELYKADSLEEAAHLAGESEDIVARTAEMGKVICQLAEDGNDIALAIIQEGTQALADELLEMIDKAALRQEEMTIGMNGGIITNSTLFREILAAALGYDVPVITWKSPEIDPVFGAGLIAARINQIDVDFDTLRTNWSRYYLQSQS